MANTLKVLSCTILAPLNIQQSLSLDPIPEICIFFAVSTSVCSIDQTLYSWTADEFVDFWAKLSRGCGDIPWSPYAGVEWMEADWTSKWGRAMEVVWYFCHIWITGGSSHSWIWHHSECVSASAERLPDDFQWREHGEEWTVFNN